MVGVVVVGVDVGGLVGVVVVVGVWVGVGVLVAGGLVGVVVVVGVGVVGCGAPQRSRSARCTVILVPARYFSPSRLRARSR